VYDIGAKEVFKLRKKDTGVYISLNLSTAKHAPILEFSIQP
jgi:hypothetical protein